MIVQDDRELLAWCNGAMAFGGSFVRCIAEAGLRADEENYKVLRPALLQFKAKYPHYFDKEFQRMLDDGYDSAGGKPQPAIPSGEKNHG